MKSKTLRNVGLALALVGVPATAATVVARTLSGTTRSNVVSIKQSASYQDGELLRRAWDLPVSRRYGRIEPQENRSSCGPSSLANLERSFGIASSETEILRGTGLCWLGFCVGGLTLDELSELARQSTHHSVKVLRDLDYEHFRADLERANDPRVRLVVNFHRAPLFGEGHGHFSPIGGFLADRNLVFVLDVNAEYRPFLVDARRLFEAMNTVDSSSGKKRGLLLLEGT